MYGACLLHSTNVMLPRLYSLGQLYTYPSYSTLEYLKDPLVYPVTKQIAYVGESRTPSNNFVLLLSLAHYT